MAELFVRRTFTLPPDQAQILEHVARRVGASQSAVLSVLLSATLARVSTGLEADASAEVGARRLRGPSAAAVRDVVLEALGEPDSVVRELPDVPVVEPVIAPVKRVALNAPCPCGSGKKYKRCCGSAAATRADA